MKNTFEYRYFLFVNYLANKMVNMTFLNFAELIKSEREGRFMNSQMTSFFYQLDETLSGLMWNEPEWVFDFLDIEELAELSPKQLKDDYNSYCLDDEEFFKLKMD